MNVAEPFIKRPVATSLFTLTATSPGTWANTITATVDKTKTLTLFFGKIKEEFPFTNATDLVAAIKDGSRLVTAAVIGANGTKVPDAVKVPNPLNADDGGPDEGRW